MTQKHFAAMLGFAFVAAWIGFNFGYAILCLVGAALFYAAASFLQGELDLGELQDRLRTSPATPAAGPPRRPAATPRVR
jgi:hypothetical protein